MRIERWPGPQPDLEHPCAVRRVRLNIRRDAPKERAEQDAVAEPVVAARIVDKHAAWHASSARGMAIYRGDDRGDGRCGREEEGDASPVLHVHLSRRTDPPCSSQEGGLAGLRDGSPGCLAVA